MTFWPADWGSILLPHAPLMELIVRASSIFLGLFLLLRLSGREATGGIALSDVLVMVLLATAVRHGITGRYFDVGDALILAAVLVFWHWLMRWSMTHISLFRRVARPDPIPIIRDGRILRDACRRELLTLGEIEEELRLHGLHSPSQVAEAFLEPGGEISVIRKPGGEDESQRGAGSSE